MFPPRRQELSPVELLRQARDGSTSALGQLLESCRAYLLVVAQRELHSSLQAKVDAADLVQETFIEAMRDFVRFRGEIEAQLLGWLRGILLHNLADLHRHYAMSCRCLSQEVRLKEQIVERVSVGLAQGKSSNICEQLIAQEQLRTLDLALQQLPPSYRLVLYYRYHERHSFAEIGRSLRCSPEAARKLGDRALERLRRDMRDYL
jgi:RNA polymerase sigma-70 factor (ECF subfamily)